MPDKAILLQLQGLLPPGAAITRAADQEPYLREWRDRYSGKTPLVLRPSTVDEVSRILTFANAHSLAIVPQSGNTGLVGGQIPSSNGTEIVLSLSRLNRIRDVDADGNTMTVEAGVTLSSAQEAASRAERFFPLSLGSQGSCQIGGNLATNAGGIHVLRYGNMRDLTLGLEAVLADGRVWNGLRRLRKDNTGYDLKHLLIGSEGTLAVITAAVLKLFPKPRESVTALAGLPSMQACAEVFDIANAEAGPVLTAFEIIPRIGLDFILRHGTNSRDPLGQAFPWYALLEFSSSVPGQAAATATAFVLERCLDRGFIGDAVVAASEAQAVELWRMREYLSEVQKLEGGSIKHDISVPVAAIPAFIEEASAAVTRLMPGARPVPFGHFGDGNIHFNVSQPLGMDKAAFLNRWDEVSALVHDIVLRYDGSISAEHGIGQMKRDMLGRVKSPVELDMMEAIKRSLDPKNILNPGKVLFV